MYTVERIPRMKGIEKAEANMKTLSPNTKWVIFNTRHLSTCAMTMSTVEAGIMIARGEFKNSLMLVYFNGYLRLVAKGNKSQAGDPYGIKISGKYNYDCMCEELHSALVKFRDDNKDFIIEYHQL